MSPRTIPVSGSIDLATPAMGGAEAFWYRKKFTVSAPLPGSTVLKVFKANYTPKPIQWGYDDKKRRYTSGIYDSVELILAAPRKSYGGIGPRLDGGRHRRGGFVRTALNLRRV